MPRKGHSEEKIVFALRQVEGGKKVGDVCREMGLTVCASCSNTGSMAPRWNVLLIPPRIPTRGLGP